MRKRGRKTREFQGRRLPWHKRLQEAVHYQGSRKQEEETVPTIIELFGFIARFPVVQQIDQRIDKVIAGRTFLSSFLIDVIKIYFLNKIYIILKLLNIILYYI